jgi:hypothetical protein
MTESGWFLEVIATDLVEDLESRLNWRYTGGAHLFLADFVYETRTNHRNLDFSQTMSLDISALLDEKKLPQLSPLIEELITPVRNQRGLVSFL